MATGWHAENFSGAGRKLKPLSEYLKPDEPPTPEARAHAVRMMFEKQIKKQGAGNGL